VSANASIAESSVALVNPLRTHRFAGSKLLRYRFGLKTADFLVCENCGIYMAAVISTGDSS
jgi:hypothetical protein